VPPRETQSRFFLDRSLGRIAVPSRLRAAGWDLVTLAEHYGRPDDEQIADVQWIQDAATHGWPILMKDKRIRYRRAEIDAVVRHRSQCFVITRGDLTSTEMADRFQASKRAIYEAVSGPGPYIYAVHSDRLELLYPRDLSL
jgi:PIN like domain